MKFYVHIYMYVYVDILYKTRNMQINNSGYLLGGEKELELVEETKEFLAFSEIC